jgi:renalase
VGLGEAHFVMVPSSSLAWPVIVVGAGPAGLCAARELTRAGRRVLVLDKGRGVGGRMATRRLAGGAIADHGAQFFTRRDSLPDSALIHTWWTSAAGEAHYKSLPSMNALAKEWARGLDVRLSSEVQAIERGAQCWQLRLQNAELLAAQAVVLTAPLPQSLALLRALDFKQELAPLEDIDYQRCIAVMVRLARPSRVPDPGCLSLTNGPLAWVADNQRKGISPHPCLTLHGSAEFSAQYWDAERRAAGYELLRAAGEWIEGAVLDFEVHGWRYARPMRTDPRPCAVLSSQPGLVLAGDAFGGPRLESAWNSGRAAALQLLGETALDHRNRAGLRVP